jgi:hypothetical protein
MPWPRVAPDRPHHCQVLIAARPVVPELDPQRAKLGFQVADAKSENQPSAGQHVQTGQLLGQHERVALRQDDHPRAEPQAATDRGGERECHDGIQDGLGRVHGRRRHAWIRQHYVLPNPDRLEACRLGLLHGPNQHLGVQTRALIDVEQRELHRLRVSVRGRS